MGMARRTGSRCCEELACSTSMDIRVYVPPSNAQLVSSTTSRSAGANLPRSNIVRRASRPPRSPVAVSSEGCSRSAPLSRRRTERSATAVNIVRHDRVRALSGLWDDGVHPSIRSCPSGMPASGTTGDIPSLGAFIRSCANSLITRPSQTKNPCKSRDLTRKKVLATSTGNIWTGCRGPNRCWVFVWSSTASWLFAI